VPGAEGDEEYRFVVDESGFDLRGLDSAAATDRVHQFCDALEEVREQYQVAASPWWLDAECADGVLVYQILYERASPAIERDARVRWQSLMDRCPDWDQGLDGLPDRVVLAEGEVDGAWSIGFAARQALNKHCVGCVTFRAARGDGWQPVTCDGGTADVFFLQDSGSLPDFWRGIFIREDVSEQDFIRCAREAFPDLLFAESLSFRRFDGSYRELREWVVEVLGVVHDHFAAALRKHGGKPYDVQAELGRFGLDLSPESPNTRAKPRVMRQRDVEYQGDVFHCEWHAKKSRHRNRVHFSLPEQRLQDRVLVGIFVDHLDT
jgi:hypothetical protein